MNAMDIQPTHHDSGWTITAIVSIIANIMAWISLMNAQVLLAIVATIVSIICGALAARYYWIASKEKKMIIKKLKNEKP